MSKTSMLEQENRLYSRRLGDAYPYWWKDKGRISWAAFADEAFECLPVNRRSLDPVAALSVLSFEYICLDRTLIQGVRRLPWLGEVDSEGVVRYEEAPPHGQRRMTSRAAARRLRELLEQEVAGYCQDKSKIYLLLSGGMDSRVMAGIVADLQKRGEIEVPVEAVTWGMKQSRDVQYAQAICERYDWEWHWAELTPENFWRNFEVAATVLGAEVDPKHLHRMDWFRDAEDDSVVLAASYGDSIGRAEYSSQKLTKVPALEPDDRNRLLRPEVNEWARKRLAEDIRALRGRHGNRSELGWREIERQAHYMRRMLCSTMSVINQWCELRQLFVAPETFAFMWSLDPSVRTDEIYVHLLRSLDDGLLDLPWARTGARYDTGEAGADDFDSQHHRYGLWLRRDFGDEVGELLFDGTLERLEIFDMEQVKFMYEDWRRERPADDTTLCNQLGWAATLSIFAERFDVKPPDMSRMELEFTGLARGAVEAQVARVSQIARRVSRPWRMKLRDYLP